MKGFVVLPDQPGTSGVVPVLPFTAPRTVTHPSGRPWLVGSWSPEDITVVTAGDVRLVVIGRCPITTTRLADLAAEVRSLADVDRVARLLSGCVHVLASVTGRVRAQGSLTGLRRVFLALHDGMALAADRADVLAAVTQAGMDIEALALRLLTPLPPPPLAEHSMWRGVAAVAPDSYLELTPAQAPRVTRWWYPPEPAVGLREGAGVLREALETAVACRQPAGQRWGADLSGGLDSTALCFLAARTAPNLLTVRMTQIEEGDDAAFAALAVAALDSAEHLVLPHTELPAMFADPAAELDSEAPFPFLRSAARARHIGQALAERGVHRQLAGHGADELLRGSPAYLHPLIRRHPLITLRHLRGRRARGRWPLVATLRALADRSDIAAWWRAQAVNLTAPLPRRMPNLGWGPWLRAPEWATRDMLLTATTALQRAADTAQVLAPHRAQHTTLATLRTNGTSYRLLERLYQREGIRWELPYLDDRVVEAALAVRPHERCTPWQDKPLLTEAMRGIVPTPILGRVTKGNDTTDSRAGFRRHLPQILELFTDSALAEAGLINPTVLRTCLLAPHPDNRTTIALEATLACETWLRATRQPPFPRRNSAAAVAP
ncbi:MAG: asparagine synthase-related protein [Pseudonocardiaceae bacterium]